jgi:hypothetical protein
LETLALLSGVTNNPLLAATPVEQESVTARVHLDGTLRGTYAPEPTVDTGPTQRLSGSGRVGLLGQVTVSGDLGRSGYILFPNRPALGTIVLTNSQGTVTLSLRNDVQGKSAGLPSRFHYTVTAGTGAYAHLADSGSARLTLHADPGRLGGHFRLVLTSSRGG